MACFQRGTIAKLYDYVLGRRGRELPRITDAHANRRCELTAGRSSSANLPCFARFATCGAKCERTCATVRFKEAVEAPPCTGHTRKTQKAKPTTAASSGLKCVFP